MIRVSGVGGEGSAFEHRPSAHHPNQMVSSEQQKTVLDSRGDAGAYEGKTYALSDKDRAGSFGRFQRLSNYTQNRQSMNSSVTIEDRSEEHDIDELYRGGTSESHSFNEIVSPTNGLKLSGKQLLKPSRNPKSFDSSSDENDGQFFSQGKDHGFL